MYEIDIYDHEDIKKRKTSQRNESLMQERASSCKVIPKDVYFTLILFNKVVFIYKIINIKYRNYK